MLGIRLVLLVVMPLRVVMTHTQRCRVLLQQSLELHYTPAAATPIRDCAREQTPENRTMMLSLLALAFFVAPAGAEAGVWPRGNSP